MPEKKIALVTGANRGLGFETCRQLGRLGYQVLLAARDKAKGEAAVKTLKDEGLDVTFVEMDVANEKQMASAVEKILATWGRVDVLVNNAGIFVDREDQKRAFAITMENLRKTYETNVLGPVFLSQKLLPGMIERGFGRVVNVSSTLGQLDSMGGGMLAYRSSKTALNAVTRVFAGEVKAPNVKINSLCPGWVNTDMGGANAPLTPEEGVDTIVWLATLPDDGPTSGFWHTREKYAW